VRLLLTSLGDPACRPAYRERLAAFLTGSDSTTTPAGGPALNPLRCWTTSARRCRRSCRAHRSWSTPCARPARHLREVEGHLEALGVPFEPAPRLVRGLDYYMRTTFEFVHGGLGAQSAVGGGGRYDGLSESIGGPPLPGIGWALGVERTLLALEAEGVQLPSSSGVDVFFVPLGADAKARAVGLAGELRRGRVPTDVAYGDRGMKGAMKAADRSGARFAVVLGDRDLEAGVAQLKDLRSTEQSAVPLERLIDHLLEELL
jgi:histidyl-tRNA synthetase